MPNLEPFTAKLEPFTADPNECLRVAMPDSTGTSELKLLDNVAICCSIVIVAPSEPDPMPGAMEQITDESEYQVVRWQTDDAIAPERCC